METEQEYSDEYMNEEYDMEQYVQGFNHSYLLAAHEPTLLSEIEPSLNPSNDYFKGFFSGREQWQREQEKAQVNELAQIRNRSQDRGNDLERGL